MTNTTMKYIPAGRTALLPKNELQLQVQTEYAPRPNPRITSCILCSGELFHKLEVPLEHGITCQDELERAERLIMRQHGEVVRVVMEDSFHIEDKNPFKGVMEKLYAPLMSETETVDIDAEPAESITEQTSRSTGEVTDEDNLSQSKVDILHAQTLAPEELSESDKVRKQNRTTLERLYGVPGAHMIVTMDWRGNFLSEKGERELKQKFKGISKRVKQALEVFPVLPGSRGRSEGIYEIENRRLYMVSYCSFIYLMIMRHMPRGRAIEEVIREALDS